MDGLTEALWRRLLHRDPMDAGSISLYGPLLAPAAAGDGCFVLGRIAQSLDGKIATASGASRWISGPADIVHTHRLRALFDAIVVGAGTVRADDPQLTTREVAGPSPVRVILDTNRRLDSRYRVFQDGFPTLLCTGEDSPGEDSSGPDRLGTAEVLRLPRADGNVNPAALLRVLAMRGLRRVFVEGGGITVSRFLAAGMLDRLHVTVAPLLLGDGVPAFTLPAAAAPVDGMRFTWTVHDMPPDILLDIPLHRTQSIPGLHRTQSSPGVRRTQAIPGA
jgi:diaminohydroxyphosphoribosylaminopyrimidine deaminase/5-amino-6-(5-phosphoribosylamino)uracil reductase